jgi:SAM-dependent methyltransferase
VLDIGCGIGRVALALTKVITTGTYDGFDLDRRAVRWCQRHITPRHPNFRFTAAEVVNPHYNAEGVAASRFRFPYADASFDFAWATSVIPHMEYESAANYFREAARVLRPGGTLVVTGFVVDEATGDFTDDRGDFLLRPGLQAGSGIAFRENALTRLMGEDWIEVRVEQGGWRGRPFAFAVKNQDVIVGRRA